MRFWRQERGRPRRRTVNSGVLPFSLAKLKSLTDLFRKEIQIFVARFGKEESGSSFNTCDIMEEAPVLIMVWNSGKKEWETEAHSVAAAIQNMLLRAHDLGLGSLWIGDIYYAIDTLKEYLGKPWKLMAAVSLGYATREGRMPPKMSVDEVSEFLI